jgi:hypothetical protein
VVTKFPVIVATGQQTRSSFVSSQIGALQRCETLTNLGLIKCVAVKSAPRTMQMPPTTTYAIPRKGFFPPMTVRVESRIDLVPS